MTDTLLTCANPACRAKLHGKRIEDFRTRVPTCPSKRCKMAVRRLRPVPADAAGSFVRDGVRYVRLPPSDPYAPMTDCLGYVPEHRLIAARALGRPLQPGERVLRRDGDPQNNAPDNLVVVLPRRHA